MKKKIKKNLKRSNSHMTVVGALGGEYALQPTVI